MALALASVPTDAPKTAAQLPPLLPVTDPDTGNPSVIKVAGVTLAVVCRAGQGPADYVLARHRAARAATPDYSPAIVAQAASGSRPAVAARKVIGKPARVEGWTPTARLADIARAVNGGLIA